MKTSIIENNLLNKSILRNFGINKNKFFFFNGKGITVYIFKGNFKKVIIEPPLNIITNIENINSKKNIKFII